VLFGCEQFCKEPRSTLSFSRNIPSASYDSISGNGVSKWNWHLESAGKA
jgi:hypothetical protein